MPLKDVFAESTSGGLLAVKKNLKTLRICLKKRMTLEGVIVLIKGIWAISCIDTIIIQIDKSDLWRTINIGTATKDPMMSVLVHDASVDTDCNSSGLTKVFHLRLAWIRSPYMTSSLSIDLKNSVPQKVTEIRFSRDIET